ncbi:conserved exported hypothetical protein [Rhodococcus sp. RD6.2]|nr:conserved exported hypothetical protein [Rhodococcus sp. RD6.2]
MQGLHRAIRSVPFPFVGYVMGLLGFIGLGTAVSAFAYGHPATPALAVATLGAFVAMTLSFRVRAYQIAHTDGESVRLSLDPLIPAEDSRAAERYLARYRAS